MDETVMSTPTLKEQILTKQVHDLQMAVKAAQHTYLVMLATITHFVGGELTLTPDDFKAAKGLMLTQAVDKFTGAITFRVRTVGKDGGAEDGTTAPPPLTPLRAV
jgi:hypothetical protein